LNILQVHHFRLLPVWWLGNMVLKRQMGSCLT